MNTNNTSLDIRVRRFSVAALAVVLSLQLSACVHQPMGPEDNPVASISTSTNDCQNQLALNDFPGAEELDPTNIRLFNWNVHKTRDHNWTQTLDSFATSADLILFQEASLREETILEIDSSKHWTFIPGYRSRGEVTGVMTLSSIKPLTQCGFVHAEPLLRTPKATNITRFALGGTDETLMVVNVHAVNFSLGLGAFEQQFEQIQSLIGSHNGPVILSGDLNTWRPKRMQLVEALAAELGLEPVAFATDHRIKVFGQWLDHIYVRGLYALDASTQEVDTSDHNPMSAVLSM